MANVLHVAEKPSVAREVARILSRGSSSSSGGGGQSKSQVHEWRRAFIGQQRRHRALALKGHLKQLDFEQSWRSWRSCDPKELICSARVRKDVRRGMDALLSQLISEARSASALVLWLDCDREGENIAAEARDACLQANSHLTVFRARFSALTQADVENAMNRLARGINEFDVKAVDVRQEVDLRVGAAFTRFQTLLLGERWSVTSSVLSFGPCQFPTLGFIVQRWWEHQAHTPEDFWRIKLEHTPAGCQGTAYFNWDRGRAFDPLVAAVIEDDLVSCNRTFEVLSSTGKRVTRNPPEPLNTVELQKRACRVTRASPHQVLQWAEELYQSGYISYPRTETNKYPSTFDLNAITHELTNHGHFGQYAHSLLSQGLSRPRAGNQDDGAHPPIYPAKHIDPNSIGGQSNGKYLVYELVARHFLATVSPLAVGRSTEVNVQCASETFTAKGLCIERHGYLDVYGPSSQFSVSFDRWSGSGDLPRKYTQGEVLQATRVSLEEGKTEPPALLTEPELISAMDRAQIGTDATQAAHIEKVVGERGYAERTAGDRLKPTNLGEALAYGYKQIGLHEVWRPDFRAKMEAQVNSIATNQSTSHPQWHDVLQNLLNESVTQYSTASAGKQQLESSLTALLGQASRSAQPTSFSLGLCPSGCGDEISVRRERDGTWKVACACRPRNKDLELERLPKVAGNLCASANVCQQPTCTAVGSLNLLHFSLPAEVLHPNESRYAAGVDLCVFCEQAAACTAARVLRDQERACNQQREQPYAYQQRAQQPPDHQAPLQAQQQLPNAHFTSLQSNSQWQAQPAQQHGQGHPPRSSGRSGSMGRQGSSTGRGTTGRGKQSNGGRGDVSGGNRMASAGGASSQAQACKGRMGSRGVRGRGRKGGKNSKGCFKCGAKNHWANSCPQSN